MNSPSSRDEEVRQGIPLLLLGHLLRADRHPLQLGLRDQVWRRGARPALPREGLPIRAAGRVAQQDFINETLLVLRLFLFKNETELFSPGIKS